ncbi:MAG: class II fructose-bisphosphate aldolase [Angelakisella sp.]|nr:class II fructose-bisphosphate aldolase [Angelakisella sp.]
MLTSSKILLSEYRTKGKCLPAFNIYNLETMQAALDAAYAMELPVILAFGEGYLNHASFEVIAAMARELTKGHPVPVVLHLDHCKSIEHCRQAIDAGFTSVMYDGSRLPLEQNIANTLEVVAYAHPRGVTVEGELGGMNEEDGSGGEEQTFFTDIAEAKEYVTRTGIDSLAVSVGNAHGLYKGEPKLDFGRIADIYYAVKIPLVLHGCSGISFEDIRRASQLAVAKINVNTEIAMAAALCASKEYAAGKHRYELLTAAARARMVEVMSGFLVLGK